MLRMPQPSWSQTMNVRTYLLIGLCAVGLGCSTERAVVDTTDESTSDPPDLAHSGPYSDFPASPILDQSGPTPVPSTAPDLFGPGRGGISSGGPCLIDPELGALVPRNWLRMRFRFRAPAEQNLFEIRVHTDNQANDLVVYTSATSWTMPADLWSSLSRHSAERPIRISIRGAQVVGDSVVGLPMAGSSGEVTIAPVDASGTIVYWTTSSGTVLRGFKVGEETVHDVLKPSQSTPGTMCVGCHSSTPDGNYVAFSQTDVAATGDPATIGLRSLDGQLREPSFLTTAARALLGRTQQQLPTFSAAHWKSGDRIALSVLQQAMRYEVIWTDLEAASQAQGVGWGVVARSGDSRMAAAPMFSHSGRSIAYVSTADARSGVTASDGDIYIVPFNSRAGGIATPVAGASSPSYNEFYPAFSPDDSLLAFSRLPVGQSSYNHTDSELYVIPASGGSAVRISGNDPPACSGKSSPGVLNSWPKWAPEVQEYGGRQFYWISFSSTRTSTNPQLYIVGVVVEADGTIKTYKALHLWNQPASDGNHTAAWDVFKLIVG